MSDDGRSGDMRKANLLSGLGPPHWHHRRSCSAESQLGRRYLQQEVIGGVAFRRSSIYLKSHCMPAASGSLFFVTSNTFWHQTSGKPSCASAAWLNPGSRPVDMSELRTGPLTSSWDSVSPGWRPLLRCCWQACQVQIRSDVGPCEAESSRTCLKINK
jgi:hypothetical protein